MARTFDGKRVSDSWYDILTAARNAGVSFRLNSGQRTFADQQRLYNLYKAGIGALAAYPSHYAPHIRTGREDHALDVDMYFGDGISGLRRWLSKNGLDTELTVPGEGWHLEATGGEVVLKRIAAKLRRPPTILERLRSNPIRARDRSPSVRAVQIYLKRGGYYKGKIAKRIGTYGPVLQRAVRDFQKHVGLTPDGIVGPKTFAAMRRRWGWKPWQLIIARRKKNKKEVRRN